MIFFTCKKLQIKNAKFQRKSIYLLAKMAQKLKIKIIYITKEKNKKVEISYLVSVPVHE